MQNKKRLHRHLLLIYIIYFAALIVGFAASFVPDFSRGWRDAQDTLEIEIPQGGIRSYYVSAPVVRKAAEPVVIEGLPASIEPTISRIDLRVQVDEAYTLGNAFKVMGNNVYCYLLMVITGLSYLTILVLIALIINSLRKSIRDEQPLRHSNILRTRAIGILILVAEQLKGGGRHYGYNNQYRRHDGQTQDVTRRTGRTGGYYARQPLDTQERESEGHPVLDARSDLPRARLPAGGHHRIPPRPARRKRITQKP